MQPIRRITLSGFRGILNPLSLDFVKGNTSRSMIIHGSNGTGKSSITDAWEWFHSGRIAHLAREGAKEDSYPHCKADDNATFVEIEFVDGNLGTIHMHFDRSRVTRPIVTGNIATLRAMIPHPCQIRFEDLTRFVYLTKADRYDALAQLMGFMPQVEFQKSLRRILRQLGDAAEQRESTVDRLETELSRALDSSSLTEEAVVERLNELLTGYGLETSTSMESVRAASRLLTEKVEADPRAQELAELDAIKRAVQNMILPSELEQSLRLYISHTRSFKQQERGLIELLLIDLYDPRRKRPQQASRIGRRDHQLSSLWAAL